MADRPSRRNGSGGRAGRPARVVADELDEGASHPGLELEDDPDFQRRSWTFERIGWWVVALILLAATLGLFGRGPLSRAYVVAPDSPLALEYDRFGRLGSGSQVLIHLLPGSAREGEARVWIERSLLEGVEDLSLTPEPVEAGVGTGRAVYRFAVRDPEAPVAVVVRYRPAGAGPLAGAIGLEGRGPIRLRQFIYP